MDCEKFDAHIIDELYGELDEVTHAAMRRHAEGCARCGSALSGLRATREVGVLPLVEPSDDLEARILEATAFAQRGAPWHRKLWRGVAWAGSHAMRPQLAMAAVFVLCIGASLMLLPGGNGAPVASGGKSAATRRRPRPRRRPAPPRRPAPWAAWPRTTTPRSARSPTRARSAPSRVAPRRSASSTTWACASRAPPPRPTPCG